MGCTESSIRKEKVMKELTRGEDGDVSWVRTLLKNRSSVAPIPPHVFVEVGITDISFVPLLTFFC